MQRKRKLYLSIIDYHNNVVCDLYDNKTNISGQAANVHIVTERNGFKELSFDIPTTCTTADGEEENYRLKYLISEYKIKAINDDGTDFFTISEPKIVRNAYSKNVSVRASHISQQLKNKNLDLEMSDDEGNNVGTAEDLLDEILKGTNWSRGNVGVHYKKDNGQWDWHTFLEDDRSAMKRSLTGQAGTGSLSFIEKLCDVFEAKPIYYVDENSNYKVDIVPMNPFAKIEPEQIPSQILRDELDVIELYYDRNVHDLTKTTNTENMATRLYAYGSSGDLNGACTLQNAIHYEFSFTVPAFQPGTIKEFKFNLEDRKYYFKGDVEEGDTLVYSTLDLTSQSYIFNVTKGVAYHVYKSPIEKAEAVCTIEYSNSEEPYKEVQNDFPYLLGLTYYDNVGLLTENEFQTVATFQRAMPGYYRTAQEKSKEFIEGEALLSKIAQHNTGLLKLKLSGRDGNKFLIDTESKDNGVIYRSDYDVAERRYFKWHITQKLTEYGYPVTGTPSLLFVIHDDDNTYQTAYLKEIWDTNGKVVDDDGYPKDFEYSAGNYPVAFTAWNEDLRLHLDGEGNVKDRVYLFCTDSMSGLLGSRTSQLEAVFQNLDKLTSKHPVIFFDADKATPPVNPSGGDLNYQWPEYQWMYAYHADSIGTLYFNWHDKFNDELWYEVHISDEMPTSAEENGYFYNTRRKTLHKWMGSDGWLKIEDKQITVKMFESVWYYCQRYDELYRGIYEYYFRMSDNGRLDYGNYAIYDGYNAYWTFKIQDNDTQTLIQQPIENIVYDYSYGALFTNAETDENNHLILNENGKPTINGELTAATSSVETRAVIYPTDNELADRIFYPGYIKSEDGTEESRGVVWYRTGHIPVSTDIAGDTEVRMAATKQQEYHYTANFRMKATDNSVRAHYRYEDVDGNLIVEGDAVNTFTGTYSDGEIGSFVFTIPACPYPEANAYAEALIDTQEEINNLKDEIAEMSSSSPEYLDKVQLLYELEEQLAALEFSYANLDRNVYLIISAQVLYNRIYAFSLPVDSTIYFYDENYNYQKKIVIDGHYGAVEPDDEIFGDIRAGIFDAYGYSYIRVVVPEVYATSYIKPATTAITEYVTDDNDLLQDRPFVYGAIDDEGNNVDIDYYRTYNIEAYENTVYEYDLPADSRVYYYNINLRYLGFDSLTNETSTGEFTTPADARFMRFVSSTDEMTDHYVRMKDYDKKFYMNREAYYVLNNIETYGEIIGITPLVNKFANVADDTFGVCLPALQDAQQIIKDEEQRLMMLLGDMLKDGRWQDSNYISGDEKRLYDDALYMHRQVSQPEVTYSFTYLNMFGHKNEHYYEELTDNDEPYPWPDVKITQVGHLVDMESNSNCWAYIDKVDMCYDKDWETTVEIDTKLTLASRHGFTDVIARIAEVAKQMKAKQNLYDQAASGKIAGSRLEGAIDINQVYLDSGTSNWYNDSKGNLIFEAADGLSAVQISGRGIGFSSEKLPDGTWQWRTAATGYGLTADVITAGTLSADRIEAGTITLDHLASNVGKELEISSNKALLLYATEDGSRPAGSLRTTDGYIEVKAGYNNTPAKINIVSGGELNLNGGRVSVYSEGQMDVSSGGKFTLKSQGATSMDSTDNGLFIDSEKGVNFAGGRFKVEAHGDTMDVRIKADYLELGRVNDTAITMDALSHIINVEALNEINIKSGSTITLKANKTLNLFTEGDIQLGKVGHTFTISADELGGPDGQQERAYIYYNLPTYSSDLTNLDSRGLYLGTDGFALKQKDAQTGTITALTAADGKVSLAAGDTNIDNEDYVAVSVEGNYRIWAGHPYPESAPFSIQKDGTIYTDKGILGGFTVTENQFNTTETIRVQPLVDGTPLYIKPEILTNPKETINMADIVRVIPISTTWARICSGTYKYRFIRTADVNMIDTNDQAYIGLNNDMTLAQAYLEYNETTNDFVQPYAIWCGTETASNAPFSVKKNGTIYSVKGLIGGFTITENQLSAGSGKRFVALNSQDAEDYAIWAGAEKSVDNNKSPVEYAPFRVHRNGTVYMSNAIINGGEITINKVVDASYTRTFNVTNEGVFTANGGYIGGWEFNKNQIKWMDDSTAKVGLARTTAADEPAIWAGGKTNVNNGIGALFRVFHDGKMIAQNADIIGTLRAGASNSYFGGYTLNVQNNGSMYLGNWYIDPNDFVGPYTSYGASGHIRINCNNDGHPRIAVGSSSDSYGDSSAFRVYKDGEMHAAKIYRGNTDVYLITSYDSSGGGKITFSNSAGSSGTGTFHNPSWVGLSVSEGSVSAAYGANISTKSVSYSLSNTGTQNIDPGESKTVKLVRNDGHVVAQCTVKASTKGVASILPLVTDTVTTNGWHHYTGGSYDAVAKVSINVQVSSSSGGGSSGGGGVCFVKGSKVKLYDGRETPIESLRLGDIVMSYDEETKRFNYSEVQLVQMIQNGHDIYDVRLSSGRTLTLTDSHPVYSIQGWKAVNPESAKKEHSVKSNIEINQLQVGDTITTVDGEILVEEIKYRKDLEGVTVYNIDVEPYDTYVVENTVVHNAEVK